MKIRAKMEVEFEFDVPKETSLRDAQHQGKVFLQTQLHLPTEDRCFNMKRYELKVVEESIGRTTYYIYHDEGYYKDADGKYDDVYNFGKHTLQWCIDYMNHCRASSSPKRPPIKVLKVKKWQTGRSEWMNIFKA